MIILNGNHIPFNSFPNGETLVNHKFILVNMNFNMNEDVTLKYENDLDLIHLMFLKKYIENQGSDANLTITYMPYSRMDRSENGSAFTLKYVSEFINSLRFKSVTVLEPHSDVTPALLNKCNTEFPTEKLFEIALVRYNFDRSRDYVFFPDGGAAKRYGKMKGFKQLVGYKERDFDTGQITKFQAVGDVDTQDFKVIIIDDLCSRGGTFILSAEKLKKLGAKEIYLVVGHCEGTIYDGEIPESNLIDEVLTTDTILNESKHEKVHIVKFQGGLY